MSDEHGVDGGVGDGGDDESVEALGASLRRRTVLSGLLGTAAGGVAGAIVADRRTDGGSGDGEPAPPPSADEVRVEPTGELVAEDVQSALVDVVGRSSALARLDDLRVAVEVVEDFVSADGSLGTYGWAPVVEGSGSRVEASAEAEGGVVVVDGAGGRAGLHLGLASQRGLAVFTMEWRVRVDGPGRIVVGAVSDLDGSGRDGLPSSGAYFTRDGDAAWSVVASNAEGRTVEETGATVDADFHRLRITCDGDGIVRFSVDDELVASLSDDLPREDAYGPGLAVEQGAVAVDWCFCRRELPR